MIYLIGGAPRVGKTQLAEMLIRAKPMASFSLDYLYNLEQVVTLPGFGGAEILEKGRAFYPTLKQLLSEVHVRSENCIIEGEVILPEFIQELSKSYTIRCCFVGMSSTSMEAILDNGGYFNWPKWKIENGHEDEVRELVKRTVARSSIIREEADKYNQRYFDLADNYETRRKEVIDFLLNKG